MAGSKPTESPSSWAPAVRWGDFWPAQAVLLGAVPEVDLHAPDAPVPQLGELGPAHVPQVHAVARRLRHVVVGTAGVVPEEEPDVLRARVGDDVLDLARLHEVPVGV